MTLMLGILELEAWAGTDNDVTPSSRRLFLQSTKRPKCDRMSAPMRGCVTSAIQPPRFIAQFTTDIRHISGQDNVVAGTLSRVESVTAPPSHDILAASQDSDDELRTLLASNTALRLEKQQVSGCGTSAGKPRPFVPASLRLRVFQSIHDLSHPGTKTTGLC
jgi:hypothetical protein